MTAGPGGHRLHRVVDAGELRAGRLRAGDVAAAAGAVARGAGVLDEELLAPLLGLHSSGVPTHLPSVFSNSLYSFGSRIFTVASMPEWLVPQYSAQKTFASPVTVGVNWMKEY